MRRKYLKKRISACLLLFAMIFSMLNTAAVVNGNGTAQAASVQVHSVGSSSGSTTINLFKYSLNRGYDEIVQGNDGEIGLWHATNEDAGHAFVFTIDYSVSGVMDAQPGDIEIRIPLHLIAKKDGSWGDALDPAVPLKTEENLAQNPEYVYEIKDLDTDSPYLVITNYKMKGTEQSSAKTGFFEIGFILEEETYEYQDMYISEAFKPEIWTRDPETDQMVKRTDGGETIMEDPLYVQIDTQVKIDSTKKTVMNNRVYDTWNSSWGEKPADADEYSYIVWEIETEINKFLSQKYDFWIDDVPDTEGLEVVAYRMQGCGTGWYDKATMLENGNLKNLTLTGKRYDYVLTRHKKSQFDDKLVNEGDTYTVQNTATAIVTPADGIDEPTTATDYDFFTRTKKTFTPPIGTASPYKRGLTNTYQLNDFRAGINAYNEVVDEITDLQYRITSDTYGYTWTYNDGADTSDYNSYGKRNVFYSLTDDTLSLSGEGLVPGDYRFDSVSFDYAAHSATFNSIDNAFYSSDPVYTDTNKLLNLQILRENSSEYKTVAIYNMQAKVFVFVDDEEIGSVSNSPAMAYFTNNGENDVAAYRFTSENNFYSLQLNATPSVSLKRNSHTLGIVKDLKSAELRNTVTMLAKRNENDDEPLFERSSTGRDMIYPETRESLVNKEVTTSYNNALEQHFTIKWHAWMNETAQITTVENVRQESGTFYDLLPDGNEVDLDSIFVEIEDGRILPASSLEITVTPNYKNSNRTLLKVEIKDAADSYDLYFDTIYSWESIHDYGRVVYNPIAYETGNATIANGQADNGGVGKVTHTQNRFFSELDPTTGENDRKFIYNEHQYDAYVVTAAASGLDKKIRDKAGSTYSYATVSAAGETYMYQLRYANGNVTKAENIILYDNIEEYTPTVDGTPRTRDWRGTLVGIDISHAVRSGILPRIYISTAEGGLDFSYSDSEPGNTDVSNTEVWTEIPIDYSAENSAEDQISEYLANYNGDRITSVAIDFSDSFKSESSDSGEMEKYVLDKGETVFAILYMKAPEKTEQGLAEWTSGTHSTQYPMTYNDVYVKATLINEYEQKETYVYEQAYTSAGFHITGDVKLHKYNTENPVESVSDILFHLYGTSSYGESIDVYSTTDRYGNLTFSGIELGTYTLQEVSTVATNPDWVPDHTAHTVTVGLNEVLVDGVNLGSSAYPVGNEPRAHTDVAFTKHEYFNKNIYLDGAMFRLSGTSDYGNDILMVETSDEYGNVIFSNLEAGRYTMREVEAPDGYIRSKAEYTVVVDENGNYNITASDGSLERSLSGDIYISNERYHNLLFYKTASVKDDSGHVSGIGLNGATFSLTGYTLDGDLVSLTAVSDNAYGIGSVYFSDLNAGNYILCETAVPDGSDYILDSTNHVVTISRSGVVTIDGVVQSYDDQYEVYNPSKAQEIVVVKVWEDGLTEEQRDALNLQPLIKVSTEDPTITYGSTAIFGSVYNNPYSGNKPFPQVIQSTMKRFERATGMTVEELKAKPGAMLISDSSSEYEIWGWYDTETGTFYWQTAARKAQFNSRNWNVFCDCKELEYLDLTGIDTSTVTNLSRFFYNCNSLKTVKGKIDASSATSFSQMFALGNRYNGQLQINIPNTDELIFANTQNVTNFSQMFQSWTLATRIPLNGLDTSGGTNFSKMFLDCNRAAYIGAENIDTSSATNLSEMFSYCYKVESLDLSHFNTSNVTNMSNMFKNCTSLTSLDLTGFDTSKVTTMRQMFYGMFNVSELDLSSFDTSNVTNIEEMFVLNPGNYNNAFPDNRTSGSSSLTTIYVSDKFKLDNVTTSDTATIFSYCDNLVGGNGTALKNQPNPNKYRKEYAYIDGKDGKKGYFTEKEYTDPSAKHAAPARVRRRAAQVPAADSKTTTELSSDNATYCTIVKSGNTWTYTFTVGEYEKAYAWEDFVPEGYTADVTLDTPAVIKDGKATIKNKKTVNAPTYGNLHFAKSVVNQEGDTVAAWPTTYHFTIILTDSDGNHLTGVLNCDGTIFIDGECTLSLSSNNQTDMTISNIPSGYHYTITETEANSDTVVAVNGTDSESVIASGVIAADQTEDVRFRNTVIEDKRATADVKVKKLVTGGTIDGAAFTFYADLTNLKVNTEYRVEKEDGTLIKTFTSDEYGEGFVSFALKHGETAVLKGLPYADEYIGTGATYLIDEARAEDFIPSYVITDANGGKNIVRSHDASSLNTSLTTARETVDPGEAVTVTYSNEIVQTRDLVLEKKLDSPFEDDRKFEFTIQFTDLGPETAYYVSGVGRIVSDNEGKAQLALKLAAGEKITFRDLPVGCTYKIVENEDTMSGVRRYVASYQIVTNDVGSVKKSFDSADAYGEELSTSVEAIDPGEDNTVVFTNVLTRLTVSKTVTGNMGDRTKPFNFKVLFLKADGTPMAETALHCIDSEGHEIASGTDQNGYATFALYHGGSMTFTGIAPGTEFEVIEDEDSARGYTVEFFDDSGSSPTDGKGVITLTHSNVEVTNSRNVLITTGADIPGIVGCILVMLILTLLFIHFVSRRRLKHQI